MTFIALGSYGDLVELRGVATHKQQTATGRKLLELVQAADLEQMLGVSRQMVNVLTNRKGFPEPVYVRTSGEMTTRVWLQVQVLEWAQSVGRKANPITRVAVAGYDDERKK